MMQRVERPRDPHLPSQPRAEHHMGMSAFPPELRLGGVWTAERVRRELFDVDPESPLARYRFELIDGELLATSSPSMEHQYAVGRLLVEFDVYLRPGRAAIAVNSPSDIDIVQDTLVRPAGHGDP